MLDVSDVKQEKLTILNKTELDEVDSAFDVSALRVLASRYLLKDEKGMITESPKQMFERIAVLVAISDILYDERVFDINGAQIDQCDNDLLPARYIPNEFRIGKYELNQYHWDALCRLFLELNSNRQMKFPLQHIEGMLMMDRFESYEARIKEYYDLMVNKDFLPNTPTLMNAGAPLGQLSACFVLDIKDDMASIMDTAKDVAMIFKSGGGVGINYSGLRQEGDNVKSTSGVASGPISFMKIIDAVTDVVKQGGKRRGANMGIMDASHPDIDKFITVKTKPGVLENFNISVGIDAPFWKALVEDDLYHLYSPRNTASTGARYARNTLNNIAQAAWESAEPGLIFFDNINKHNPLSNTKGPLSCTNPCGEQSLYPYESCNLGSINLANFVDTENKMFDWVRFIAVVRLCTRFLDNIIDVNKYPLSRINEETKKTRRIGLGIMGLADALFKLNVPYNSTMGYAWMDGFAERLSFISMEESTKLAQERGPYPLFNAEDFSDNFPVSGALRRKTWISLKTDIQGFGIRNAWTTTVAPTGTLSMLANCSGGIEPIFGLSFEKHVTVGKFSYLNQIFMDALRKTLNFVPDPSVIEKIIDNYGSCKGIDEIPKDIQDVFLTAMDIHWADHVYAEAVWQRWISNAIAKTINMPGDATRADVARAYMLAHELGLKGITVYRDGSRATQVLNIASDNKVKDFEVAPSEAVKEAIAQLPDGFVKEQVSAIFIGDELSFPIIPEIAMPLMTGVSITNGSKWAIVGGYPADTLKWTGWKNLTDGNTKCPSCGERVIKSEGCMSCKACGWSACSSS